MGGGIVLQIDTLFAITFILFASQNGSYVIESCALNLLWLTSVAKSCVKSGLINDFHIEKTQCLEIPHLNVSTHRTVKVIFFFLALEWFSNEFRVAPRRTGGLCRVWPCLRSMTAGIGPAATLTAGRSRYRKWMDGWIYTARVLMPVSCYLALTFFFFFFRKPSRQCPECETHWREAFLKSFTHWTFEALKPELSAGTRRLISHTGSLSASDGPGAVSQTQEWPEREAPGSVLLPVDRGRSAARVYRSLFSVCDPSLLHHLSLDADTQLLGYLSRAPIKGCHSRLAASASQSHRSARPR